MPRLRLGRHQDRRAGLVGHTARNHRFAQRQQLTLHRGLGSCQENKGGLTAIAVGLPLFGYAPRLYRGLVEYRLGSIYRSLRVIEASLQADIDREDIAALAIELERLDREVNKHRVPMRHSDIFFRVKSDLHLVRMRLGAQRAERRPEHLPDRDEFSLAPREQGGLRIAAGGDLDQDGPYAQSSN